MMKRRVGWLALVVGAVALVAVAWLARAREAPAESSTLMTEAPTVVMYKSPTCGCCVGWAEHMRRAGFIVEEKPVADMAEMKRAQGVPRLAWSCHTAVVDGYIIEGHVPAAEVQRLLTERPDGVVGLAVPGMPAGSPGMEVPGGRVTPYAVLAFDAQGQTSVYATYREPASP